MDLHHIMLVVKTAAGERTTSMYTKHNSINCDSFFRRGLSFAVLADLFKMKNPPKVKWL